MESLVVIAQNCCLLFCFFFVGERKRLVLTELQNRKRFFLRSRGGCSVTVSNVNENFGQRFGVWFALIFTVQKEFLLGSVVPFSVRCILGFFFFAPVFVGSVSLLPF